MAQDSRKNIQTILENNGIFTEMFDILRIVDAERGILMEYGADGLVRETAARCFDVLGSSDRCKNCTSYRAYNTNETLVKLEFAGGSVLLIFSCPVTIDGRDLVVEMVKDISKSMTVDIEDERRATEVTGIIDNLNRLTTTDALTGLYNRRFLDEKLPAALENAKLKGRPLSIALIDLDDFKKINDIYGHAAGDHVLIAVSAIVLSNIRRGSDWAARFGGEEMLLCFAGVTAAEILPVLERIRTQIDTTKFEFLNQVLHVTASIGLTDLQEGDTLDGMFARCDALMYTAKNNGKNRIEF